MYREEILGHRMPLLIASGQLRMALLQSAIACLRTVKRGREGHVKQLTRRLILAE